MTSFELSSYILAGALLQISFFGILAFYRHWVVFQDMKRNLSEFSHVPSVEEYPLLNTAEEQPTWVGSRKFRVDRRKIEDENQTVCSFYLVPIDAQPLPIFHPGQFLTFELPLNDPASAQQKKVIRCYSLSDQPGLDYYRVSIKRLLPPAGLVSNYFHDTVKQGDVLDVRPPNGHFFMKAHNSPVVLIAGGIGITPMLSMLNSDLKKNNAREIWLFYGIRNSMDHVMKTYLEDLAKKHSNFRLHICYSQPLEKDILGTDYQHKGHVDITLLKLTLSLKAYQFYICGPAPMMESIVPCLDEWGVPKENVHYEAFGPASFPKTVTKTSLKDKEKTNKPPIMVSFSQTGQSIPWDENSNSLLDFAEKNNIPVESGCRAGGCGACQTTIEQGEVEYIQAPDFDPDPGSCLLCVSRPTRDLVLKI